MKLSFIGQVVRRGCAERGQAVVEFAVVLPLMLLLIMGVLDFSIAVAHSAQLTGAVQEGASYARTSPNSVADIRDHVKKEGPGLNLLDANIVVTCYSGLTTTTKTCSSATFGDSVTVQATYVYTPITGRLIAIVGSTMSIVQSATSEIY